MAYSYIQEGGEIAICNLLSSVPSGAAYAEVNSFPEDRVFRGAWRLVAGELVTSLPEAKLIAHEKRRQVRSEAFKPLDVEATIPSKAVAAEAARQVIRDADDAKQIAIDGAADEAGLRSVM
tara:strand:- start:96 stop:458 length:363 start_codon:yes stop_codon:yes gene_type:complete